MSHSKSGLKRDVGLFGVIALAAGAVIGGGPFFLAAPASALAGPSVWLSYLVIGLPMIAVAVCYAAIASAMPIEGGTYYYPTRVFSPFWGFLAGWARWLAYITPLALTAFVFSDHIQTVAPGIPAAVLMVGFIGFFYLLNVLGIKISATAQMVMFGLLVLGFLIFIGAGLPKVEAANFSPAMPQGFGGVVRGAALLFFAYVGFTAAAEIGEEVKKPERNVPLGMILGLGICIILYVLMSIAASGNLNWQDQAATNTPIFDAAKLVLPGVAASFLLVIVIMAVSTSQNGFQLAASRIVMSLGRDRAIPERLSSVNSRFGTPVWGLTATVLIALIFVFSGKGLVFAVYTSNITFLFSYIVVMVAVMVLKKRKPELYEKSPIKLKGAWQIVLPVIAIIVSIYFIALQEPTAMLWSAVWLVIGAIVFLVRKQQLAKEGITLETLMQEMRTTED
ncbi:MAG: amino acid permease [Dehalococcoidia bacterium]|nr:amino acid permease [Dehalococcoidia bacterium]